MIIPSGGAGGDGCRRGIGLTIATGRGRFSFFGIFSTTLVLASLMLWFSSSLNRYWLADFPVK